MLLRVVDVTAFVIAVVVGVAVVTDALPGVVVETAPSVVETGALVTAIAATPSGPCLGTTAKSTIVVTTARPRTTAPGTFTSDKSKPSDAKTAQKTASTLGNTQRPACT